MCVCVCVIASQWGLPLKRSFVDLSSRLLTSHSHIAPSSCFYLIFFFALFVDLSSQLTSHTHMGLNALLIFTELYPDSPTISFGILQCQLLQNCNNCKFPPMQQLQSCVPLDSNEAMKLMSNSGWNLWYMPFNKSLLKEKQQKQDWGDSTFEVEPNSCVIIQIFKIPSDTDDKGRSKKT